MVRHRLTPANIAERKIAVFPLSATRQENGFETKLSVRGKYAQVRVFLPESDAYSFIFRFARTKDCWTLRSVEDWSL